MKYIKDFNTLFWSILGVNNRVFEPIDVFKNKRDKRADEKKYDIFLKSDNKLSNPIFFNLNNQSFLFYELIFNYFMNYNKSSKFYANQINNIIMNFKIHMETKLEENILINLFAFQISNIIEYMVHNNIDITMFEKCLLQKNFMPVIDLCKKTTKTKSLKDLATKLCYKNSEIKENLKKRDERIEIEEVNANTFQKDLTNWKNNNYLPSFIKLRVIANIIYNKINNDKEELFIQLILIRSLLNIQKKFDINEEIQAKFIDRLTCFREIIKKHYLENSVSKIEEEQSNYVIDYSNLFNNIFNSSNIDEVDIKKYLDEINNKLKIFNKYNDSNETHKIKIPYYDLIVTEFNKCKNENDYLVLLNKLPLQSEKYDEINLFNNQVYFILLFTVSIKTNNQRIFNKYFKLFDRSFGLIYSRIVKIEKNVSFYNSLLENIFDINECREIIKNYLVEKISTLE